MSALSEGFSPWLAGGVSVGDARESRLMFGLIPLVSVAGVGVMFLDRLVCGSRDGEMSRGSRSFSSGVRSGGAFSAEKETFPLDLGVLGKVSWVCGMIQRCSEAENRLNG